MRTSSPIGLTLLEYCGYLGIDMFTMAQFGTGFPEGVTTGVCDVPMFQHQWQRDMISRDEFGLAINQAEQMIAEQLSFWTFPRYTTGETVQYPRPNDTKQWGGGATIHGQWKAARLQYGKILGGGILARTLIAANQVITRLDEDLDGLFEIFEIVVLNVSATLDLSEVGVYIRTTNRTGVNKDDGERWRIRPIHCTLSGTTLTIRGHSSCIAMPVKYEGWDVEPLDIGDAANYLTNLDVYRVYLDDTATVDSMQQGTAIWENTGCLEPPCGVSYYPVCLGARDAELGFVSFNWTQAGTTPFRYDPDRAQVNYLSGVPLADDHTAYPYGAMVAQLATALLPERTCGCDRADKIIAFWKQPIFEVEGDNQQGFAPNDAADNPFGFARGAVYAWRAVLERRQVRANKLK